MQTAGIDPRTVRLADLADLTVMEAKPASTLAIIEPLQAQRPLLKRRDAKQQLLGAMRIINHLSGGDMRQQIDTVEFLSLRVDELEAQIEAMQKQFEAEKASYQNANRNEIAGYKKALRNIAAVLMLYTDPFDLKPFSKWKNDEKGKWILAAGESVKWAVQRADNQLDPINAVVIAADEV